MNSRNKHVELDRRQLLKAILGSSFLVLTEGCNRPALPMQGELLAPNHELGHRLRDGFSPTVADDQWTDVGCLIVGGGIAGLSAGWQLQRLGYDDFTLLEMEPTARGTAMSSQQGKFEFPWGAHYVPVPMPENQTLIELFDAMDLLAGIDNDGSPIVKEQFLCRDPEERLFIDGEWIEGLYPLKGANEEDLHQLKAFRAEVDRWVTRRDEQDRRMFAIPTASGSDAAEVTRLDSITMSDWMHEKGWDSARLRWTVDYACRDDYGLTIEQTSAWAGLFYFVARVRRAGDESQAVVTWPAGNGHVVRYFTRQLQTHIRSQHAAYRIEPGSDGLPTKVYAYDNAKNQAIGFRCDNVIFAAPQFLAPHLIEGFSDQRDVSSFRYGSWMVANVHLRERPQNVGFASSWDNVIYDSKSLGYVVSTHQTGNDHGPTVITWYYPFAAIDPTISRKQLLELQWSHWADIVLSDLEVAHPDIRELTTRLDIMRWGHAMIQPRPGFVWSEQRRAASQPLGNIHFAGTDLSGVALLEEAFYHGVRAAQEVAGVG